MKLRVISVGKDKSGLFEPAVREYLGRLTRHQPTELLELRPAKAGTAERARAEEGERILGVVRGRLVALDAGGKSLDSEGLARQLDRWRTDARDVDLVVGGDEGLAPEVLEAAELRLSLSALTLPHRLARLVLVEQLYRAMTILRGEPYHK